MKLGRLCTIAFADARGGLGHVEDAVALLRETDARDYLGLALLDMGQARLRLGQLEPARQDIREGLRLVSRTSSPDDLIEALETMAEWLGSVDMGEVAVRAWGADKRAREDLGSTHSPGERAWMAPLWARHRRTAGEPRATLAWEAGRSMGLEEAVAAALGRWSARTRSQHVQPTVDPRGASPDPPRGRGPGPRRRGLLRRADRRAALHQQEDGLGPRRQHQGQARHREPRRDGAGGRPHGRSSQRTG